MSSSTKVEALREAIAKIAESDGSRFFDHETEELKAPVRAKAMRLINQRARSRKELFDRICEDPEVVPGVVNEVLDDLTAAGALNDAYFAQEWVRQRHLYKKKSGSVLRRELKEKGIAESLIDDALGQVTRDSEAEILRVLVEKKAATIKTRPADRKEYDKCLRRVVGVAARRGFSQGMSLAFAREAIDNRIAELPHQES
ncbi:recombination regulator RecX [Corynebacterium sp. H78]|uniref:recombination regulator RecX n=1 Tax=Corynebacterium sp. H78 TaxID=3133417 RepID=UPI0030B5EE1B